MQKIQMSRRQFTKASVATVLAGSVLSASSGQAQSRKPLRLGGPVSAKDPDSWVKTCQELGYRAAYCPVGADASDDLIKAYRAAADKHDIVIAEVGAWSNPIATNEAMRKEAIQKCKTQLALAERIGANCCVNVAGSRHPEKWAGPHKDNLTRETFEVVVETTRDIIDAVKPTRTYFTLECMPWSFPDSVQSYLRLIEAIDRKAFAVHFDPVNLVVSPRVYFFNGRMIRDMFEKLGPRICSCHAKDITIDEDIYTPHLSECRPGTGALDYAEFLRQLAKRSDTPLMMEHLSNQQEYKLAADHIRSVAAQIGLSFA
ncbi:MAG: sugar phosphate isomerase/epimerase [Sedimentisphaerales bacterium]|nr:sugar phosphate isomerase/epimerase [Sedimentisphaerales bacterium]